MRPIVILSILALAGCGATSGSSTNAEQDFSGNVGGSGSDQLGRETGSGLTVGESDASIRKVEPCWNPPYIPQSQKKPVVAVRIWLNRDGTVRRAVVVDSERLANDQYFRAMAESALRAVLNPDCQPFKLPPDKHDAWKEMTLIFDPTPLDQN